MSISTLVYVMCDRCGDPAEAVPYGSKEARSVAKEEGWKRVKGKDVCPRCLDTDRGA